MASPPLAPAKVHYPSSDGRPMAESDFQRTPLTYAVDRLRHHFRGRRDAYVSGNLLLYYEEGNPRASVALDVREYWQYDPTRDYLEPSLQGLELSAGKYRRLREKELADGTLALASTVLGLELRLTGRGLRFHDPESGSAGGRVGGLAAPGAWQRFPSVGVVAVEHG